MFVYLSVYLTIYLSIYIAVTSPLTQERIRPELHQATAGLPWALESSCNEVLRHPLSLMRGRAEMR